MDKRDIQTQSTRLPVRVADLHVKNVLVLQCVFKGHFALLPLVLLLQLGTRSILLVAFCERMIECVGQLAYDVGPINLLVRTNGMASESNVEHLRIHTAPVNLHDSFTQLATKSRERSWSGQDFDSDGFGVCGVGHLDHTNSMAILPRFVLGVVRSRIRSPP